MSFKISNIGSQINRIGQNCQYPPWPLFWSNVNNASANIGHTFRFAGLAFTFSSLPEPSPVWSPLCSSNATVIQFSRQSNVCQHNIYILIGSRYQHVAKYRTNPTKKNLRFAKIEQKLQYPLKVNAAFSSVAFIIPLIFFSATILLYPLTCSFNHSFTTTSISNHHQISTNY